MALPGTLSLARARARLPRPELAAPILIAALAFLVFGSGLHHELTNWDDQQYIANNPLIRGLSWDRLVEAFARFHVFNYNPLHIVSYMVDYEMWGLQAGGFFLTSLVLHTLTAVLVFRLARRWLGSAGAALFVAAVFLVHPTRVESVAWLSERKDVLSGFFAIATVIVYGRNLHPAAAGEVPPRIGRAAYWCSLGLYILTLLSKSQLVTLPIVLLAMELTARRPWCRALVAQAPFLVLSLVFACISVRAHAGESLRGVSFPDCLLNPLAALPRYLGHWLWPFGLSPYYDDAGEGGASGTRSALGAALVAASAWVAWRSFRGRGTWFLGLAWFYALLLPVSGIVRLNILVADRYLYLSCLGLLLPATASLLDLHRGRRLIAAGAVATVAVCAVVSSSYVTAFASSDALWRRVLSRSPSCSIAHSNLGHHLLAQGRLEEAAVCYDADLAAPPYFETSFLGRALIYEEAGDRSGAERMYRLALDKRPRSTQARTQLAGFLDRQGQTGAALEALRGVERSEATVPYCHQLFDICWKLGLKQEALAAAVLACDLAPYDPESRARLKLVEL